MIVVIIVVAIVVVITVVPTNVVVVGGTGDLRLVAKGDGCHGDGFVSVAIETPKLKKSSDEMKASPSQTH